MMANNHSPQTMRPTPAEAYRLYQGEDLTQIRGIGAAIVRRLNAAGISTYAQLGGLTPIEIATRVPGLSAMRIKREGWVRQARKFALLRQSGSCSDQTKKSRSHRQSYATFTVELLMNEDRSVRRTQAAYIQGKVEEKWAGWEEARLMSFMIQRAALKLPAQPGSSSSSSSPPELTSPTDSPVLTSRDAQPESALPLKPMSPIEPEHLPSIQDTDPSSKSQISIGGTLRLNALIITALGSDVPRHTVLVNEKINCRLGLDLADVPCPPQVPLHYALTLWARRLGTKSRQVVGAERGSFLLTDNPTSAIEITLTSQGLYRLEAMVTLVFQSKASPPTQRLMATCSSHLLQVL